MSNTVEALAALKAAEAELEAALAAEKVVAPEVDSPPPAAPAVESVTTAGVVDNGVKAGPEVSTAADGVASAAPAVAEAPLRDLSVEFHLPYTPFSRGDDVPPSPIDFEPLKPKWLVLPNYLGPIAINGS